MNVKNRFEISMQDRDISPSVFDKKNTLVVLDTNVLIGLSIQKKDIAQEIIDKLNSQNANIYIPFFVSWEYSFNNNGKLNVPLRTRTSTNDVKRSLKKINNDIQKCVNNAISPKGNALYLSESVKKIKKEALIKVKRQFDGLEETVLNAKQNVEDSLKKSDSEVQQVNTLLLKFINKHVSDGLNIKQEWIEEQEKEGEKRYKNKIGPGFGDNEPKEGIVRQYGKLSYQTKYGDFLIWQEVLEYMKNTQGFNTLVYVTNDAKDIYDDTKIYPAHSLFGDLYEATGTEIHLYVCGIEKVMSLLKTNIDYIPVHDYDTNTLDEGISISKRINEIIKEQIETDEGFSTCLSKWIFGKAPESEETDEGTVFKMEVKDLTIDTVDASVSDMSIDEIPFTASISGGAAIEYTGDNPQYERGVDDGTPAEISQSFSLDFVVSAEGAYDLLKSQFEDTEFIGDIYLEDNI